MIENTAYGCLAHNMTPTRLRKYYIPSLDIYTSVGKYCKVKVSKRAISSGERLMSLNQNNLVRPLGTRVLER